jgi:DNA-directed RNA polymerase I subunit RPA1
MTSFSCPGHPGHIELPVPVYHATFMDQMMKLLNSQCAFCGQFKLIRTEVNRFVCKLRLLGYGLVNEAHQLEDINVESVEKEASEGEPSDKEDKIDSLIEKRKKFVKRAIKRAGGTYASTSLGEKIEAIREQRRQLIKEFFATITKVRACSSCKGISPSFRKDKYNKVFRKPLSNKDRAKNAQIGKKRINYLIQMAEERRRIRKEKLEDREVDEGIVADIESPSEDSGMSEIGEVHVEDPLIDEETRDITVDDELQEYCNPDEVLASLNALFEKEQEVLRLVYNIKGFLSKQKSVKADMFFLRNLLVPPNRFRPQPKAGAQLQAAEAQQNTLYKKILTQCQILNEIRQEIRGEREAARRRRDFKDFQDAWVSLQDTVNSLIDSDRNPIKPRGNQVLEEGIKQKLEKKEGLFRKNMMGKRVNFAARSVISPDPNIETNEIGVPPVFARKLTYPEPVTSHNFYDLKEAVLNGPTKWPGAAAIENENGQIINLKNKSFDERQALANQLLAPSGTNVNGSKNKKVHRHLNNGDILIMNRQPTLHKPSMMCHKARILPGEKTIRMHYANCNTYNADFDGDEMNMHFPQNENARAEAMLFADTDHQYLVATAGKPLRGLIQDHISMGVWLTNRDTFFTKAEYHELLYSSLRPEHHHTITDRIETIVPAFIKPQPMWTGKQIITTILKNITSSEHPGLTMTGKSSTPRERWGEDSEEGEVVFQSGEMLCGILDKGHLGPSAGGFVHSMYEAYGHTIAGKLLSILGRLLTKLLHMRAFSCGMEDIVLTQNGNTVRREKLDAAESLGREIASKYVTLENVTDSNNPELKVRLEDVLRDDQKQAGLDGVYNSRTASLSSEITKACLPSGLFKPFPRNQMQLMTTSGAKGSSVQTNLISCNLGQQVLEGRRVPMMVSGKSLPSFKPFETNVRAGGYITDRFLTGVRPQAYFFHAMAGREGLIDTAVKTSRSGYLQRCLIKGMEGLRVEYDTSVRDSDGSMVQFLYGEDGLDITKQRHLKEFRFTAENFLAIVAQLNVQEVYEKIFNDAAIEWQKKALKMIKKTGRIDAMDPVISHFNPGSALGSTSESFAVALKKVRYLRFISLIYC